MADGDIVLTVTLDTSGVVEEMNKVKQAASQMFGAANSSAYVQQMQQATQRTKEQGDAAEKSGSKSSKAFNTVASAVQKSFKSVGRLTSAVGKSLSSAFNKVKSVASRAFNFKGLTQGIKSIARITLGVYSLTAVFNKLRNAAQQGLNNLVQFHSKTNATNQAMTAFKTSMLYLQNAWAAAFAPIVNFVMPLLTQLIDKMAAIGNAVARFVGALTGQKTVLNAVKVSAGDYAKSLDKTKKKAGGASKATKKLTDRLAAFDDLNVLGKDNPNAGGGAGGAGNDDLGLPDPNKMFKKVSAVSDLAKKIKEAWAKADFTDLGKELRDKLVAALEKIDWGKIKDTAYKVGKSVATFLNGALGDPVLWQSLGEVVAEGLNTLTQSISGFLQNTKVDFGGGFATLINSFFANTDWGTIKSNIELFGQQLMTNINSFFSTLNFDQISFELGGLAGSLTTALVNLIAGIDWEKVRAGFTQIGDAIIKGIEDGFKKSDNPIIKGIGDLIGGIREALNVLFPVIQQIFAAVQPIISAILPVIASVLPQIATIIQDIATLVLPVFSSVLQIIMPIIERLISTILPILHSVLVALQPAFSVLTDTILPLLSQLLDAIMPVVEAILNAVGALLTPVANLLAPLLQLVGAILEPLISILKPILAVVQIFVEVISSLLAPIVDLISPIIELVTNCLSPLFNVFSIIGDIIGVIIVPVFKLFSSIIQAVVIPIIKALQLSISALGTVFKAVADVFKAGFTVIKTGFETLWKGIKVVINWCIGGLEAFANAAITGINKAIGAINKLSFDVPDWVPGIGGKKFGFNIKEMSTIKIPRLAEGAVIPPNKEFMAVLGDQKSGTNIEAPLDTIKQAVAEVVGNNGSAEMIQLLQQLIVVVENKNLVIGDKDIGKANARYSNQQRLIRGTSF